MNVNKSNGHHSTLASALLWGMVTYTLPIWADTGAEPIAGHEIAQSGVSAQIEIAGQSGVEAQSSPNVEVTGSVYVLVNGRPITVREYNQRLVYTLKNKYYHGKVPEGKEEETRKELTDEMVDHVLLLEEAEKRGFKPDEARIEQVVASEERKNRNNPQWLRESERLKGQLRTLVGQKSILDQLEAAVKDVPTPSSDEVKVYFDQHPELFTEPEKLRLSVILFRVDPGSTDEEWQKAYDEAKKIADQIRGGADFAEMARKYSQDKTAKDGGDMGYLHRGRVPAQIQEGVDKFTVGEVSAPYKGLEGISIFRLEDRIPPKKMEFQKVEQRATALNLRDKRDQAWKSNLDRLRNEAKIEVITKPTVLPGQGTVLTPEGGG